MAGSGTAQLRGGDDMMLKVEHLVVEFGKGQRRVQAVSDVSFDVAPGETLGLVGESGCGKSTTGRAAALVHPPDSGSVQFAGTELTTLSARDLRQARTKVQMVFQDPISSLNPRRRVLDSVMEPMAIWGIGTSDERRAKARQTLESVGINPNDAGGRRPIEFSGGQCQRISIARALMLEPSLLICDEPVSALDVSVQAQILNLLDDLKRARGLTMVFIAHDLAVVKNVSDRVAVMYLGKLCEVSPPDNLYRHPAHPYTAALLASIPEPDPSAAGNASSPLTGELPSPTNPPSGCRFRTRCPYAQDRCAAEEPQMRALGPDHFVACHFPLARPADIAQSTETASPLASATP
ncbi:MAG TPA: ABC transporter ATP-binding protein [Acidimicrobiales bacterium]